MQETCYSCCFWNSGFCIITKRRIPEEKRKESYCESHKYYTDICAICGSIILKGGIILEESHEIICEQCFNAFGSCKTCKKQCSLEKDYSMPHFVMKTFQQGGMTIQGQVINPDLVQKHCPSCSCFQNNVCCRQEYNSCSIYEPIFS